MIADAMNLSMLVPALPILAAIVLASVPHRLLSSDAGAWTVIAASTATFALSCRLPWTFSSGPLILVDPLSAHIALLTSFVAMTTAWFSRAYIAAELLGGRLDAGRVHKYHALYQAFLGFMLLALLSNNLGVAWVAMEAATISAVLVAGLPRTAEAVEASWKFFMLCGVGIALALFGTIVLYLAALPVLGAGLPAMSWSALTLAAPGFRGPLLDLAFVFLLIGYGTKAGLAPLHAWMPDAHADGPTPVSAVLAGSILNVALTIILRVRAIMAANPEAIPPGPPIMALGLLSILLGAFTLWPRRDAKRFFAFSTIEQSGIAALAIGLGGELAIFAAVLHMTLHTLAKAAVFQCIGAASLLKGGQRFSDIGGLLHTHRALGLVLATSIAAMAGLPPFGLFASEFLVVMATIQRLPWLVVPLALGLVVGAWALVSRLIPLCTGAPTPDHGPDLGISATIPACLHLFFVIVLGLAMPGAVVSWFNAIAASFP